MLQILCLHARTNTISVNQQRKGKKMTTTNSTQLKSKCFSIKIWKDTKPLTEEMKIQRCHNKQNNEFAYNYLNKWKFYFIFCTFSSVQFSRSVVSNSLRPNELQHARPPCPSPTPRVHTNPYPLSRWCHPTISSSVVPFSSCPQSFPASGSSQMSRLFASSGQSIGVSASVSVLPMNTQDWSPLGWTGWFSLQSKGLSRVFSNTTVQKHQFFGAQLSL